MILPKKTDLDKARVIERKNFIDEGIALAKRVDELRRMKADEEKRLLEWQEGTRKVVQKEIDTLVSKRDEVKREIIEEENRLNSLKEKLTMVGLIKEE